MNENQFTWRSSQNYTLSYYHLTFSESNRLIVSVMCLVIHKSNLNNYKIVKNTSMKQSNWTTRCSQNEAESARALIWLESVTEKETGNAQPGAWVDVLPRCLRTMYPAWIFYFRWRLIAVASWILKSLQSTGGTSLENSRHENLRNRKKCFWNKKPHLWSIYLTSKSSLPGKSGTI